ncbi:hypothetical protein GQ457_18G006650 [Hibiscus cannabinus]
MTSALTLTRKVKIFKKSRFMFFDVLSSISKPDPSNSDPKTSESDLEPEPAYNDLIEGFVGRRNRLPAQLSSFRYAQPRESVITNNLHTVPVRGTGGSTHVLYI